MTTYDPHFDDPTQPQSRWANAHLRRNRQRVREAVEALFTIEPRLEMEQLVLSLAGRLQLHPITVRTHILALSSITPAAPLLPTTSNARRTSPSRTPQLLAEDGGTLAQKGGANA